MKTVLLEANNATGVLNHASQHNLIEDTGLDLFHTHDKHGKTIPFKRQLIKHLCRLLIDN